MGLKTMHLFAGAGGGLLADLILGHEPICAVEWDAYCCQVLRERSADGWFPGLHVYEGDIRLFGPSEYAGRVDCIHAGFPCQPFSVAGNQEGSTDERGELFAEVVRISQIVRPKYIFLENVSGFTTSRSPSCLCGWPYRRGGVFEDTSPIEGADIDLYARRANEYVNKGKDNQGSDVADVRWEYLRNQGTKPEMVRAMAVAYQWGRRQRLCEDDLSISHAKEATSGSDPAIATHQGKSAHQEEWPEELDAGGKGIGCEIEGADAQPQPEGAGCPQCGRRLVSGARPVWYMESVLWSLAGMGFDARWCCVRASDVGAPHQRDRWWCLATHTDSDGSGSRRARGSSLDSNPREAEPQEGMAHPQRLRQLQPQGGQQDQRGWTGDGCADVADTTSEGFQDREGGGSHEEQQGIGTADNPGSGSGEPDYWRTEPDLGRVVNGIPARVDRIKGLGNAQVPLQAAVAWRLLAL